MKLKGGQGNRVTGVTWGEGKKTQPLKSRYIGVETFRGYFEKFIKQQSNRVTGKFHFFRGQEMSKQEEIRDKIDELLFYELVLKNYTHENCPPSSSFSTIF